MVNKRWGMYVAGIVLLALFPFVVRNPYYIHLAETILIYAILFFIIAQGQVEVLSKGVHGSNLRIALLTEGEFFGETDLAAWFLQCPGQNLGCRRAQTAR